MDTQLTTSEQGSVPCLMIPAQGKNLLLPNVTVAEVVGYVEPEPLQNGPKWLVGYITWRGLRVPVMSYELANSQIHAQNAVSARIAILNADTGNARIPFMGIVVQGIPRMVHITDNDVNVENDALSPAEQMVVSTVLGKAVIPNLDYLESLAAKVV